MTIGFEDKKKTEENKYAVNNKNERENRITSESRFYFWFILLKKS